MMYLIVKCPTTAVNSPSMMKPSATRPQCSVDQKENEADEMSRRWAIAPPSASDEATFCHTRRKFSNLFRFTRTNLERPSLQADGLGMEWEVLCVCVCACACGN